MAADPAPERACIFTTRAARAMTRAAAIAGLGSAGLACTLQAPSSPRRRHCGGRDARLADVLPDHLALKMLGCRRAAMVEPDTSSWKARRHLEHSVLRDRARSWPRCPTWARSTMRAARARTTCSRWSTCAGQRPGCVAFDRMSGRTPVLAGLPREPDSKLLLGTGLVGGTCWGARWRHSSGMSKTQVPVKLFGDLNDALQWAQAIILKGGRCIVLAPGWKRLGHLQRVDVRDQRPAHRHRAGAELRGQRTDRAREHRLPGPALGRGGSTGGRRLLHGRHHRAGRRRARGLCARDRAHPDHLLRAGRRVFLRARGLVGVHGPGAAAGTDADLRLARRRLAVDRRDEPRARCAP